MVTWSKDYVALRVGTCQGKSAPCLVCVHGSSARGDIYFACYVTSQD